MDTRKLVDLNRYKSLRSIEQRLLLVSREIERVRDMIMLSSSDDERENYFATLMRLTAQKLAYAQAKKVLKGEPK